jgi:Asp-tRNA(Asn)/Glu-tRNA(Gln) amidotransferase A subunit family amidase
MPMGLQMTTPLFTERALLGYAHAYERATRYADKLAPVTDPAPSPDVTLSLSKGAR